MARPEKFPRWATSEDATLEEPSEEAKDLGHVPNTVLTARLANWLQNLVYEWLVYLDEEVAGGGGGGGAASALQTTGASVDVAAAAPPVAGQVLMAIDAEHAQWKVPGLHYDSAIRFWIESAGEATIEPGTWGFVYQTPVGSSGVTVSVVSSLTSPPVDSRIGLYVSPIVDVPVTVSLIGASQIMGLDGTLASSITLRPGAMYEWVFYHEASVAIWGLVSDTAHVAKAIATTGDPVDVSTSAPPTPGQVLLAVSPTEAEWTTLPDSGMTYGGESNTCAIGEWVTTFTNGGAISIPSSAAEGDTFGVHVQFSGQNKHITVPTDQELQLEGRRYAEGETVALRAGAYYEWSAVAVGEGLIRWLPRASHHTLTPPLERADPDLNPPRPNQLVYASETDPVTLPGTNQNLKDGDSFAVMVDTEGCVITVPSGVRLYAIDGGEYVDGPGTLTLFASTYHEWIYHADLARWMPRESGQISQDAFESALGRDVGTSLDMGGKILSNVETPDADTDAATKAYCDELFYGAYPYLRRNSAQHANSDEFDSGSSDMVTRGWLVRNMTDGASCTRVGDVDPLQLSGSTLATNTYRSTRVGSYMLIEVPNDSKTYLFYKPFTPAAAGTIWSRAFIRSAGNDAIGTSGTFATLSITAVGDSGGFPVSSTNYVATISQTTFGASTTSHSVYWGRRRAGAESLPISALRERGAAGNTILGFKYNNTPVARHFVMTDAGVVMTDASGVANAASNMPDLSNIAYMGIQLTSTSANGAVNLLAQIDFFRQLDSSAWIIP